MATFLSRILGLLREQAFAALLGAGLYGDAFTMAFRLPNLLRDLFAEGALSAAFQPAFLRRLKEGGREEAARLANLVATVLLLVVGALTLLGVFLAPVMVEGWAAGYAQVPGKSELTVLLTRIMMPFLLLVSLASVAMGMLNAEERFLWPALAPALFNLAAIIGGGLLWALGVRHSAQAATGWAVATLLGGALQLLCQVVPLWRAGHRFWPRLDFRDPGLREIALAMAPATVGVAATQVNVYINSSFASQEDGAVTWLSVAFRLLQLPIGVFGVAVGTVALARAARSMAGAGADAEAMKEALAQVREQLRAGLKMVAFLTLPSTAVLALCAEPIIALIYQHGAFRASDTGHAAIALRMYSVGLCCYAAVKVAAPVYYALRRTRVPVTGSLLAVLANVLLSVLLHRRYGYAVLALGTSCAAVVNLAWLLGTFQASYGGLREPRFLLGLLRIGVASAVMALVLDAAQRLLAPLLGPGMLGTLLRLVLVLGAGGAAYLGLCLLLQVEELSGVMQRLRRRRG